MNNPKKFSKKTLGVFQIVMINVIAVDSIRTLPFATSLGFSLVFYYILAGILFFIPSALVSAELGTGWPNTGGIYVWVREAFGNRLSLIVIWLNWIYNLVWYPTIMALIAGTFTYFFDPKLANSKIYMTLMILGLFWVATFLNCLGMKVSSLLSTLGALIGTILPMIIITVLGIFWIIAGHPINLDISWNSFFPDMSQVGDFAYLTTVLFGLLGLEMAATHAAEMKHPQRDYPKAVWISVFIVLISIVFSALAIAFVVPEKKLNLVTGTLQAFSVFTTTYNVPWLLPLMAGFIILGGLSGVAAWVIGPTKGLMVASQDGSLPKLLTKTNKHNVPVNILMLQGVIVSVLSMAFILMPSVNSSFWLLSAMTAQLALLVYIGLFLSAIKLHYSKPHISRAFQIPYGKIGIWTVAGIGALTSLFVICLGFIPPSDVEVGSIWSYELTLIGGIVVLCLIPIFIYPLKKQKR